MIFHSICPRKYFKCHEQIIWINNLTGWISISSTVQTKSYASHKMKCLPYIIIFELWLERNIKTTRQAFTNSHSTHFSFFLFSIFLFFEMVFSSIICHLNICKPKWHCTFSSFSAVCLHICNAVCMYDKCKIIGYSI